MKKLLLAFLTSALILTAAGCGEEKKEETKNDGSDKVSQSINFGGEDTTDEAVAYLKTVVPYFSKYLETRMEYPLTYEAEITTAEGTQFAGIYIRDESSMVISAVNLFGSESKTIYTADKMYSVDGVEKIIYSGDYKEENSKRVVSANLLKIDVEQAKSCDYTSGEKTYNGVNYKHESISMGGATVDYYFDMNTGDLKYVVSDGSETKVLVLENKVKESAFDLPEGYKEATLEEYYEKIQKELDAQQSNQ